MQERGEDTPLDHLPILNCVIERWFYSNYNELKSLSGFEYQITITDFKHYFDIYPVPFCKFTVISVIKQIEAKVEAYRKLIKDAKGS